MQLVQTVIDGEQVAQGLVQGMHVEPDCMVPEGQEARQIPP